MCAGNMAFGLNVFHGRPHYKAGLGDVLEGIRLFLRFEAMSGAKRLLKVGSQAIQDSSTLKDVLKLTLKPTVRPILGATAEQLVNRLAANQPTAAPQPGPKIFTPFCRSGQVAGSGSPFIRLCVSDLCCHYNKILLDFKNFSVTHMEHKHNRIFALRQSYTTNFAN